MATIKEIVYDLKNIIRGGLQSDDEMISDRQIEFQVNSLRAQFIRQDINKRRTVSDNIKQIIPYLMMEPVPASLAGLNSEGIKRDPPDSVIGTIFISVFIPVISLGCI